MHFVADNEKAHYEHALYVVHAQSAMSVPSYPPREGLTHRPLSQAAWFALPAMISAHE